MEVKIMFSKKREKYSKNNAESCIHADTTAAYTHTSVMIR
jgi:hypothetical protein